MNQRTTIEVSGDRDELTAQVLRYQRTGEGFEDLMERVGTIVYRFPKRRRSVDDDDCGEFFCFFAPKIPGLLRRFVYRGSCFEAYLTTFLRWQYKTFLARKACDNLSRNTLVSASLYDEEADSEDAQLVAERPVACPQAKELLDTDPAGVIGDPVVARRVILLLLCAAEEVDKHHIEGVAAMTGADPDWLSTMIAALHTRTLERRERRASMRERRDMMFFRLCRTTELLSAPYLTPEVREKLVHQRRIEQSRFERARAAASRVPTGPTHGDIAAVLNMPKGSVDSALYYLRNTLKPLQNADRCDAPWQN